MVTWRAWAISLAVLAAGCREKASPPTPAPRPRTADASKFICRGSLCRQRHVRLPDDGEWRCAEREGLVWCAGGEPAAGVLGVSRERGYVCGRRRGHDERVCVDVSPDYPPASLAAGERRISGPWGRAGEHRCRFVTEDGLSRECVAERVATRDRGAPGPPDCWLDADCAPGRCDRGTCTEAAR
jgi:hypothetical protein